MQAIIGVVLASIGRASVDMMLEWSVFIMTISLQL
jgi:hypothetical protein